MDKIRMIAEVMREDMEPAIEQNREIIGMLAASLDKLLGQPNGTIEIKEEELDAFMDKYVMEMTILIKAMKDQRVYCHYIISNQDMAKDNAAKLDRMVKRLKEEALEVCDAFKVDIPGELR